MSGRAGAPGAVAAWARRRPKSCGGRVSAEAGQLRPASARPTPATRAARPPPPVSRVGSARNPPRQDAFSIIGWEVAALAGAPAARLGGRLAGRVGDQVSQLALVRAHFANTAEIRRLRARRDELFRRPPGERADLAEVERQLGER